MTRYVQYGPHAILERARGAGAEVLVRAVIDAAADEMAADGELQVEKVLDTAQRTHEHLRADLCDLERRIAIEETNELVGGRGSRAKAFVYRTAGLVGFVAEFALLWTTFAWVFSMPQHSLLGVCAALAPLAVTVVLLKEPLERLAHAAYRASFEQERTMAGTLLLAIEYLFLLVAVVGALAVAGLLGNMREIARRAREVLAAGDAFQLSGADQARVLVAILGVTLLVAAGGAACFAYASVYGWAAALRSRARRTLVKELRPERAKVRAALRGAEVALGAAVIEQRHAQTNARRQAIAFKTTQDALLAIEQARVVEPPSQPVETFDSIESKLTKLVLAGTRTRRSA